MHLVERIIEYYSTPTGKTPYREWFYALPAEKLRALVRARLGRLRLGHFGDCKSVGEGVLELRIHAGPGYRVYFMPMGSQIVLLLCGGDKSAQEKDIAKAKEYGREYKRRFQ